MGNVTKAKEDSDTKRPAKRPKTEAEYLDCLEDYIRDNGRTPLRKLGNAVPRPQSLPPRALKDRLLRYRSRFIVDLQGCAELNHARRWRWRTQPLVTRARRSNTVFMAGA